MTNDWLDKMVDMMSEQDTPIQLRANYRNVAKQEEVGVINEESGAGFIIDDRGRINISSGNNLGILIDKEKEAMIIAAPNLHIFSENFQHHEGLNGDTQLPRALENIKRELRRGE